MEATNYHFENIDDLKTAISDSESIYLPAEKEPYDPKHLVDKNYPGAYDFIEATLPGLFHIKSDLYSDLVIETCVCRHCGGTVFNVGTAICATAIRCVTCEYEIYIHEG